MSEKYRISGDQKTRRPEDQEIKRSGDQERKADIRNTSSKLEEC